MRRNAHLRNARSYGKKSRLKCLFFLNPVTEYDASISKITQLHLHYKDRFNNAFTAILLNESFIKMFSQPKNMVLQMSSVQLPSNVSIAYT